MKIVKHNPFMPLTIDRFFDDISGRSFSDFFGSDFVTVKPSVNVIEHEDSVDLELTAPGLNKEDFNIEIDKNSLIISASREKSSETEEEGKFMRREFNYSSFRRSFHLSDNLSREEVVAKYENGILTVQILKKIEAEKSKKTIEIV